METTGWLAIALGVFTLHAVFAGRVASLPTDLRDILVAAATGNVSAITEVWRRASSEFVVLNPPTDTTGVPVPDTSAQGLAAAAVQLGTLAKGYRFTATGPDYYDCSGLMWRAAQVAYHFTGVRFTTFTIGVAKGFVRVTSPAVNDLVVWPTHHMGVVTGDDQFYSAKDTKLGIGYAKISTWMSTQPVYYRFAPAPLPSE